ncbi:MAG: hypothetical protein JZU50_02580 [Desulfobulbaceae bacterium]|nr:hypothetical protein [Desulfobulbaceae bacterium]
MENVGNIGNRLFWLGLLLAGIFPLSTFAEVSSDPMVRFSSVPLNVTGTNVTPLVMLNVSRDHQLSTKAYTDYADLDGNGMPETTYTDGIDYYGYFDSRKCYAYATSPDRRFVPTAQATGPCKHYCSGQWSGNFLNWATMTRIDVVRKLLYGGMRAFDSGARTVLERQYLPTDAHAFAKYYNGSDLASLTPFSGIAATSPTAFSNTSNSIPEGEKTLSFTTSLSVSPGDQIKVFQTGFETVHWMIGGVTKVDNGTVTLQVPEGSFAGSGVTLKEWTVRNLSQTGITLCNLTQGDHSGSSVNQFSETNTNLPIIRVAKGNFALWTANERWQGSWSGEHFNTQLRFMDGFGSNGNKAYRSGLLASAENPSQTIHGLGNSGATQGEYVARVEACVPTLLGQEQCKSYGSSFKPTGLLQMYGDTDQLHFGLMTGSYAKNISGGVLRKNVTTFTDEVNRVDGTFVASAHGIVDNLNKLRITGYDYHAGSYVRHDGCGYQQTGLTPSGSDASSGRLRGHMAGEGNCSSWGNPMAEIFMESLRYLAGKKASADFISASGSGSKDAILGLTVATWSDPLNATNYCAPLEVLNFNAGVSSYDNDQLAGLADLLPSTAASTAKSLTDAVGLQEGLNVGAWFIGSNGIAKNELCSSKSIGAGLGSFIGLCPEAPGQQGTYLLSGLAHYAHTHHVRSDLVVPPARADSRDLTVSTYGVALTTNVPQIEVQVGGKKVKLLPAYRLDVSSNGAGPFGGGALVDFKIIEQTPTHGKFYVNWEDSAMGGDYDQDLSGVLEYVVSGNTITITTDAVAASTRNGQGFGYVISGTNNDGVHFHSGIADFDFVDPTGVTGCSNCVVTDLPTSVTYTATSTAADLLQDPLWYASKYGGFVDSNANNLPDIPSEWDKMNNRDGSVGGDGLPDNFFFASNPLQLEHSLNQTLFTILQRASSGTAVVVVSKNVNGTGALYQAYYEPRRQDSLGNEATWIGTVQALWLDSFGYLREDDGNARLDGYNTDKVIQLFYDDTKNKTRVRRFTSIKDDAFTPYSMQGRVIATSIGNLRFTVDAIGGYSGSGPFSEWTVSNLTTGETGHSTDASTLAAATNSAPATSTFAVTPDTMQFRTGDTVKVVHAASTILELEEVGALWNAREQLSRIVQTESQRPFTAPAETGRFIKTWLDGKGDGIFNGVVDPGEFVDFTRTAVPPAKFGFFNLATKPEMENLIDYIRGKEIDGYRRRTIDYEENKIAQVQRLGDIVNSTPTVVGVPQEGFHMLYKDASYAAFKRQYAQRRQVVYVGSNDGMLHAFNGGFYDGNRQAFLEFGNKYDGVTPATPHPLGSEIWAYVPMNLLPHLKWLATPQYTHVSYVDGKPLVFDAKIFDSTDPDHPGGWGTVLVVGMRFGGGAMTIDTAADGLSSGDANPDDNRVFSSAYMIMDITNPEVEPHLLAEMQVPDSSFSTSHPAVLTVKDSNPARDANKWLLTFGSGPSNPEGLTTAASTTSAKFYVFDLGEIAYPGTSAASLPANVGAATCVRQSVGTGGRMKILSCDTGVDSSFVGDAIAVDRDLDYKAEGVYFGIVGDGLANRGQVMRLGINENPDPASWTGPVTLVQTSQPVVASVMSGVDETGQNWIFFGTGRYLSRVDQQSTTTQTLYGIKEPADGSMVAKNSLVDVSAAQVETNGRLHGVTDASGMSIATVDALEAEISKPAQGGWLLNLLPIQGEEGTAPATRVLDFSPLKGGVLFTSAYQPGVDLCMGEGSSRLYGLFYKTGTPYADPPIFGTKSMSTKIITTETVTTKTIARSFIELGVGLAAPPALHSGVSAGPEAVSVFIQQSTGGVVRAEAKTVFGVRSRLDSWREVRDGGR